MISCKGKHKLIDIMCQPVGGSDMVVRWCERCGAIVIDLDYDNRTRPGGVMKMMFPESCLLTPEDML